MSLFSPFRTADDDAPFAHALAITPNDGTDLAGVPSRALYIGTAGSLSVIMASGQQVDFANVLAGELRIRVQRVRATGTLAAGIVALY